MKCTALVLVLTLVLIFTVAGACPAEEKHPPKVSLVTVTGEAPADTPNARDAAINDALRNAVMARIGAYVEATAIGQDFELIKDEIIVKASGFATLESIESTTIRDGILSVKITAAVSNRPLVDKLKGLGLTREWKIGVFIPEAAAETEVIKALMKSGYRLMDDSRRKQLAEDESVSRAVKGDAAALADIKREYDVDIFVTGEASVENVDETDQGGVTFFRSRGRMDAKAYYTDTSELISMTDAFADGVDQTESLSAKQCCKTLGKKVCETLVEDITTAPASLTPFITVKITGLNSLAAASALEDAVREIQGVTQVKRQRFNKGVLELNVYAKSEFRDSFPVELEKCKVGRKLGIIIDFCSKTYVQGKIETL